MSRATLDTAVKADLDENGPSPISEVAVRIGRSHAVVAAVIHRLVDDGVLYRAAVTPGSYQRPPTPIYWFAPPSPCSAPPETDAPMPRMTDTRPEALTRLALLLEYTPTFLQFRYLKYTRAKGST